MCRPLQAAAEDDVAARGSGGSTDPRARSATTRRSTGRSHTAAARSRPSAARAPPAAPLRRTARPCGSDHAPQRDQQLLARGSARRPRCGRRSRRRRARRARTSACSMICAPARCAARAKAGPARRGLAWPSCGDSEPATTLGAKMPQRLRSCSALNSSRSRPSGLHVARMLLEHRGLLLRCSRRADGRTARTPGLRRAARFTRPQTARARLASGICASVAALAAHVAEVGAAGLAARPARAPAA